MNECNYITIKCEPIDETDITGMLLEKYAEETSYDKETKIWNVPQDVYDELQKERE